MRRIKMGRDARNKSKPYVVRWTDGPDLDGKARWSAKSFRYKADAEQFRAELKTGAVPAVPQERDQTGVTLAQFRRQWMQTVAPKRRAATIDVYNNTFDRLEAFFGPAALLSQITPQRAEQFIVSQRPRRKEMQDAELAAASRNQCFRNTRAIFYQAVAWKYLKENPLAGAEEEEVQQAPFHHLTPKQEKALLDQAPTLRDKALYDLLLTTGLRLREALSRTWREIDFEHGSIIIIDRKGTPDLPPFVVKARKKTGQKWRIIPLSPGTLDLLTQLQAQAPESVPYVFLDERRYRRVLARWQQIGQRDRLWNNRWLCNNTLRDFKHHCRKAGIVPDGKLCLHSLRKNMAQNMADAGLPLKVLQEILGHAKPDVLLQHYQQVEEHHAKLIRDLMERRRFGRMGNGDSDQQKYVSGTYEPEKAPVKG